MNQLPIVSVCMITYNHENFIEEAINSVLMQECDFEIELILANDGSSDKTDEVIQNILKMHPRASIINYIKHEQNIGMMPNFIFAMQQCKGKYVALCEGDDYWTDPYKLQKQVDFLEADSNFAICSHNVIVKNEITGTEIEWPGKNTPEISTLEDRLQYGSGGATCSLVFRNIVGEIPDWLHRIPGGDWALQVLCTSKGKMRYFKELMGVYRVGKPGSSIDIGEKKEIEMKRDPTGIAYKNTLEIIKTLDEHFHYQYSALLLNMRIYCYHALALCYQSQKKMDTAEFYAKKALMHVYKFPPYLTKQRLKELLKIVSPDWLLKILIYVNSFLKENNKIMVEGASWKEAYPILSQVINQMDLKIGAEIGVAYGGHAEYILSHTKVRKLYGVDPYKHILGYEDPMNFDFWEFNKLKKSTMKRLSPFGKRFSLIRKKSKNAVHDIVEQLDFVYIDADHSYEEVRNDISRWFEKVRDGGIIAGHDYNHPQFPGVKVAIDEYFTKLGWEINAHQSGVWWVEKKPIHISFIVPAYNCEKTIQETVLSILDTNFKDGDEIIIIDDKSTDNTLQNVKEISKLNPAIKVLLHNINKGSAGAGRNTGIDHAKNDLIFCLDSDNILSPHSVHQLKKYMLEQNADTAAFGELRYFVADVKKVTHKWVFKGGNIRLQDALAGYIWPGPSGNYLFTKKSWINAGRYTESVGGAYDSWAFGIKQLATGSKMVTMKDSYYYHRCGYESTFVRDQHKIKASLVGLSVLVNFLHLIEEQDVDYLMSKKHRYTWFENIETRPIRVKGNDTGQDGLKVTPIVKKNLFKEAIVNLMPPIIYKMYKKISLK